MTSKQMLLNYNPIFIYVIQISIMYNHNRSCATFMIERQHEPRIGAWKLCRNNKVETLWKVMWIALAKYLTCIGMQIPPKNF